MGIAYLWTPLAVATAAAGSLASLENACVALALWAAASRRLSLCLAAVAVGSQISVHALLLAVSGACWQLRRMWWGMRNSFSAGSPVTVDK